MNKELVESYQAIRELYILLSTGDFETVYNEYLYKIYTRGWGVTVTLSGDDYIECESDRIVVRKKHNPNDVQVILLTIQYSHVGLTPEYRLMACAYVAELVQVYQVLLCTTTITRIYNFSV